MLSPGNCTIQYPVQMVINKETVAQGAPVVTETYGGPQTGYNQIVIVISPSLISVSRGNGSGSEVFHF